MIISLGNEEIAAGLIGIIIISFFYNPLQLLVSKLHDSIYYVEAFKSKKPLQLKDELLLEMLNENVHKKSPSYVITDPHLPDHPIGY